MATNLCTWGNPLFSKSAVYSLKNLVLVMSALCVGSNNGAWIWFISTSWNIRASSKLCNLNPLLWSVSVRTKKMSWTILRKYCWKNALETSRSAPAKLFTTSRHTSNRSTSARQRYTKCIQFNPMSAISLMVCLIAQIMLSMNNLNCGLGMLSKAT